MTLTAVLMAGGQSRRMGRDKALLNWEGRPLWSRQLELLRALKPEGLLVSARSRPVWCPEEIEVVSDETPSRGPLSGLAATLARTRTTHLLALAIDLPFMTKMMLRRLWRRARPGRGIVAVSDRGFEGLCAIYPVEAGSIAATALAQNDLSLQNLLGELSRRKLVTCVALDPLLEPQFHNINTPADLMPGAAHDPAVTNE